MSQRPATMGKSNVVLANRNPDKDTEKTSNNEVSEQAANTKSPGTAACETVKKEGNTTFKPGASFSSFAGLLTPSGRRKTFTSQTLSSNAQAIKDMLSLTSLKTYGELDDGSMEFELGDSDEESDAADGAPAGGRPKMLPQPSGKLNGLDDADVTETTTDLSERSLLESSMHSLSFSPASKPRRRLSAPSSPFVIRKDKEGSTTKWITSDELSAPYLELNIQVANKRSSNRNRRRRSLRSTSTGPVRSDKIK